MKQTIYSKVFDKLVANERTVNADYHKSDLLVSVSILVLLFSAVAGLVYVIKLFMEGPK